MISEDLSSRRNRGHSVLKRCLKKWHVFFSSLAKCKSTKSRSYADPSNKQCEEINTIRRGLQERLQGSQVFQMPKGKNYHPCIPCESWLFGVFLIKASLCLFTREFSSFILKVTKERREVPFCCFAIGFLRVPCIFSLSITVPLTSVVFYCS